MDEIFGNARSLTSVDLSHFNPKRLHNIQGMFSGCESLTEIHFPPQLKTDSAENMGALFKDCKSLTYIDLSKFNTDAATNMEQMFAGCVQLTSIDLSNFKTSNVESMAAMFSGCTRLGSIKIDKNNFNIEKVLSLEAMFSECTSLTSLDLSLIKGSVVTSTIKMFYKCIFIIWRLYKRCIAINYFSRRTT